MTNNSDSNHQSLIKDVIQKNSVWASVLNGQSISDSILYLLLMVAVVCNAVGLFSSMLGSNDSYFYAVVAKHIITNHDFINLTFAGHDWLDKPHLPFWLTAISYYVFGINPFAYILPGFLCNLLGAYYTYKVANMFYGKKVGLLAALFNITAIHLLLSSIDVRAEAYLLAFIMGACYYWLLYDKYKGIKYSYLIYGALYTGMAIMTKGIFVFLTISSGLLIVWMYKGIFWKNILSKKWVLALILSFVFITPELISLYLQFDLHPEKVVFGHTHVSGIKFFFWDSQVGRFFETGPITIGKHASFAHYFYFVHTFLWAFLPWSMFFIVALFTVYKNTGTVKTNEKNYNNIYLLASFLPTFILFSLTKFQLDHYTNILVPFASIISANWVLNSELKNQMRYVSYFQMVFSFLLITAVFGLSFFLLRGEKLGSIILVGVVAVLVLIICKRASYLSKSVIYPVLAVSLTFMFLMAVNSLYKKDNAGFTIANYLQQQANLPVVDYQVGLNSLEFYTKNHLTRVNTLNKLAKEKAPYYLLVEANKWQEVHSLIPDSHPLDQFIWIRQEKFIPTLFNKQLQTKDSIKLLVVLVNK